MSTDRVITLHGDRQAYALECGSTNAFCRLEAVTGQPYREVLAELRTARAKAQTVHAFLAAALIHPEVSPDQVGPIVDDLGGLMVVRAVLREACRVMQRTKRTRSRTH